MESAENAKTAKYEIPRPMVWAVVAVCALPFILNQFGVDFSTRSSGIDLDAAIHHSPHKLVDAMHHKLTGSFTHTLLEWSAFCTAIFVVILSFVHFRIMGDVTTPVIGVALFCAGSMDAFHTLAADRLIEAVADNRNLIPFTWAISRLFNALILIVGVGIFLFSKTIRRYEGKIGFVAGMSLVFGVIAYALIHISATNEHLPNTMFPDSVITRPYDVAPLILFVLGAIFVYIPFYRKAPSLFSHALVISIIPQIVTQLHMAFGSTALFDNHFNIAHFLKILAYLVPFGGLSMDYIRTYSMEKVANEKLSREVWERMQVEEALRHSELRTRTIVESSVSGIIVINSDGKVDLFNPAAEQIFGYSSNEAIGNNVKMLMPSPYYEEHDGYLNNYITTGTKKIIGIGREVEGKRKDGTTFPLYLGVSEMRIGDEQKFVGMITDITKRKEAEETLRESEMRFRSVTQSASDAIISIDSLGNIVSWNRGAEKIFGYAENEALGKEIQSLMPEHFREDHIKGLHRFRSSSRLKYEGKTLEMRGLRKDGAEFPLELSLASWKTDQETFVTGIVRDITERKQSEHAIAERMRHSSLGMEIGVILTRDDEISRVLQSCTEAIVRFLDAAFARIWIINEEEEMLELKASAGLYTRLDGAYGRIPLEANSKMPLIVKTKRHHFTNSVIGDPQVKQQEWAKKEGLVAFAGHPLIVGKKVVGVVAMFSKQELSEATINALSMIADEVALGIDRKRKEEALVLEKEKAEQANRLKSDFLNTMSHELRTPLTVMLGNVPLLTNKDDLPDNQEVAEIAVDIERSGKHLLTLINDLLDLSKIEAGRMELQILDVSAMEIVKDALDSVKVLTEKKGITVNLDLDDMKIMADPIRIKQVLLNLLSNSIKFTEQGKITIKVRPINGMARFQIIDTGCGIHEDDLPYIFDSFRQVDSSITRSAGGTGLGLAITKKLVELHGGDISVESKIGEGSSFVFSIPTAGGKQTSATNGNDGRKGEK